MDIFNRPPSIAEDTLQYALYPTQDVAKDRTAVTSLAALLEEFVSSLLPQRFLWHKDAFELKVVRDLDSSSPEGISSGKEKESSEGKSWMLEGRMRVGDCVDDEWCVVWLMKEISAKWDIAISIWDNDGEFLLIEAADFLPTWVTPENSENRVWIYQNKLHLIPLDHVSAVGKSSTRRSKYSGGNQSGDEGDVENSDSDEWINVTDALRALRDTAAHTEAPNDVQDVIWKRIHGYPDAAQQHVHTAKGYLPIDIAKAMSNDPALVQKAVETFYTRDALQLRAANRMNRFPPRPDVLTPISMTRTAYAQLVGQKFYPPKVFGVFKEREGTKEWRWRDVGMKIACGFEMLYQESKSKSESTSADSLKSSSDARLEALRRNPDYQEYIRKLTSSGYFKGELEGSQLWSELEQKAAEVFVSTRRNDNSSRPSFSTQVNTAITRAGEVPYMPILDEDADDWLNIDAEDFDAKLAETMKVSKSAPKTNEHSEPMDVDQSDEDAVAQAQADKLKGFAKKVEKFVEGEGTLEGAMLEDDAMSGSDEEMSDFSDEEFPSDDGSSSDGKGRRGIEDAARKEAMDKLVPPLDPSEYGKMPAWFHSNSQKMAPAAAGQSETMETESSSSNNAATGSGEAAAEKPRERPLRRPVLTRDKFDGVDSDDETDSEEERNGGGEDDESDEDRPQVVGDVEIDMKEEEEEFLEFARQSLGIDDKAWVDILKDRTERGAYLPKAYENGAQPWTKRDFDFDLGFKPNPQPETKTESSKQERQPQPGPRPNVNPNLDSFEAVMQAMDEQLDKANAAKRAAKSKAKQSTPNPDKWKDVKGKGKAVSFEDADDSDSDSDIEESLRAELKDALETGDGEDQPQDYAMMLNFLESFKSQGGLSGPVGNLAGLLDPGWKLPRDAE